MSEALEQYMIESFEDASDLLRSAQRLAIIGIKTERHRSRPAYYVPEYLQSVGYRIFPVPVYYPDAAEILGEQVYRSVSAIPEPIDIVVVFRRPEDLPAHLDDLLVARPGAVWLQSGIRNDEFARSLAEVGIRVVSDRCTMIQHRLSR